MFYKGYINTCDFTKSKLTQVFGNAIKDGIILMNIANDVK